MVPQAANRVVRLIEHGVPEALLRDYSRKSQRHLTVVGSHGGGVVYNALIGSTARQIIDLVPGEIGRESCRERVCQYVSISVVPVSVKKKEKNKTQTVPF